MTFYNMKNVILCLFVAGAAMCVTSCANLSPFTEDLYNNSGWTEEDLKQIQFYTSKEIIIYRRLKSTDTRISGGKIVSKDGQQVEEIVIKKRTPGVFESKKDDSKNFAISFDVDGRYLTFGPNPKMGGKYTLRAKEWKKHGRGVVTYGGEEYEVIPGSGYATLLVDLKKAQSSSVKSRKAKGRKID